LSLESRNCDFDLKGNYGWVAKVIGSVTFLPVEAAIADAFWRWLNFEAGTA
jgi:hypothetical protein